MLIIIIVHLSQMDNDKKDRKITTYDILASSILVKSRSKSYIPCGLSNIEVQWCWVVSHYSELEGVVGGSLKNMTHEEEQYY